MATPSLRFSLAIDCDNAAFEDAIGSELARILRDLATRLERGDSLDGQGLYVRDINGNAVGRARLNTH